MFGSGIFWSVITLPDSDANTGVRPDLEKSSHFYTLAAEGGDNYAQDGLAVIYERRSQLAKAYFWYQVCETSKLDTGATKPYFISAEGAQVNIQSDWGRSVKIGLEAPTFNSAES